MINKASSVLEVVVQLRSRGVVITTTCELLSSSDPPKMHNLQLQSLGCSCVVMVEGRD